VPQATPVGSFSLSKRIGNQFVLTGPAFARVKKFFHDMDALASAFQFGCRQTSINAHLSRWKIRRCIFSGRRKLGEG